VTFTVKRPWSAAVEPSTQMMYVPAGWLKAVAAAVPPACAAAPQARSVVEPHAERMKTRASVQQVLAYEKTVLADFAKAA